jgi:hypothetical protein
VEHVYWPGLMFGDMLFSRAGVRVRGRAGVFVKEIAENSTLYFTNRRYRRLTEDPSHGWGSSSRWATRFRRDYQTDTHFHFNVDGEHLLTGDQPTSRLVLCNQTALERLTLEEQIELLTHRCFVRCIKQDTERRPYYDTYSCPIDTKKAVLHKPVR